MNATVAVEPASVTRSPAPAFARLLHATSLALAHAGGAVVMLVMLLSCASVAMRFLLGRPIGGDFELVQLGTAACVALFLPWCQWERGNVKVEFCTAGLSRRLRQRLDATGHLLVAVFAAVAAWRSALGLLSVRQAGESGMVSGLPLWWGYVPLLPGFGLLTLVAAYMAWRDWTGGPT